MRQRPSQDPHKHLKWRKTSYHKASQPKPDIKSLKNEEHKTDTSHTTIRCEEHSFQNFLKIN